MSWKRGLSTEHWAGYQIEHQSEVSCMFLPFHPWGHSVSSDYTFLQQNFYCAYTLCLQLWNICELCIPALTPMRTFSVIWPHRYPFDEAIIIPLPDISIYCAFVCHNVISERDKKAKFTQTEGVSGNVWESCTSKSASCVNINYYGIQFNCVVLGMYASVRAIK